MVHDELLEKRLAAVDLVEETASATSLTEDQLTAWMGAINDLRLVLGTRLDVTEEQDSPSLDDPQAPAFAVYQYLTFLLAEIVHALFGVTLASTSRVSAAGPGLLTACCYRRPRWESSPHRLAA